MGESITRLIASLALATISLSAYAQFPFTTGPAGGSQPHSTLQPSLGLNYIIRTTGIFDRQGEIHLFAGNFAPAGFKIADGQALQIEQFDSLYNLIGTTYGGDGQTTFNLPDLRGRTAIGNGVGPGGTNFQLANQYGNEELTLGPNHLPPHAHSTPAYGRLSVALQARFAMKKLFKVAKGAFRPPPKVESAVVRMEPLDWQLPIDEDLLRRAFSARRKTLRNALPEIDFEAAGIDPGLRPENLSPEDYARLSMQSIM